MDVWFIDDKTVWSIPDDSLRCVAELLGRADASARDPLTGRSVDVAGASIVADVLEVALDTGASDVGMDDKEKPSLRWAIQAYVDGQRGVVPKWAHAPLSAPDSQP